MLTNIRFLWKERGQNCTSPRTTSYNYVQQTWHRYKQRPQKLETGIEYKFFVVLTVFFKAPQDPAETILRGQWPRQNCFSGVIDPTEIRILSIFSVNIRPYAKRFRPWIRALVDIDVARSKKSPPSLWYPKHGVPDSLLMFLFTCIPKLQTLLIIVLYR
jgi:hypothetical protein